MKKMKILFCTSPYHPYNLADEKIYVVEPIQFEVLASLIDPKFFDMHLLDLRIDRKRGTFFKRLKEINPHILCMTSWTMHVSTVLELFRMAKSFNPHMITIVGGEHTRIEPRDFGVNETDFIVMGEAYQSFPLLLNSLLNDSKQFEEIPGIAYQKEGIFISNGQGILAKSFDLDSLPHPNRDLAQAYAHKYYHLWWKPIGSIRTAMGCPAKCSFCNLWKVNLGKYLQWSPEYVVDVINTIQQPYVLLVDDHFFADVKRAIRIGELILKKGIKKKYCLYSRSDVIAKCPELVELWARIGLKRVRMGLESYSDRTLVNKNKCATIEHNDKAIKILKKHKVLTEGLFIIELNYTRENFEEMAQYITSRKIEVPNITVSTPMPGTIDFKMNENQMLFKSSEFFDFQHATMKTVLPLKEFCKLYSKLIISAQRPPIEQIQIIGLKNFFLKMPNFWRYFLSLRNSYHHYGISKMWINQPSRPLLQWEDKAIHGAQLNQYEKADQLYFRNSENMP